MKNIPKPSDNAEFNIYYNSESLQNTSISDGKNAETFPQIPYMGSYFSMMIFPEPLFGNFGTMGTIEWYD